MSLAIDRWLKAGFSFSSADSSYARPSLDRGRSVTGGIFAIRFRLPGLGHILHRPRGESTGPRIQPREQQQTHRKTNSNIAIYHRLSYIHWPWIRDDGSLDNQ